VVAQLVCRLSEVEVDARLRVLPQWSDPPSRGRPVPETSAEDVRVSKPHHKGKPYDFLEAVTGSTAQAPSTRVPLGRIRRTG
jgi:hypothetical protein